MNPLPRGTKRSFARFNLLRERYLRLLTVVTVFILVLTIFLLRGKIPGVDSVGDAVGYPAVALLSFIGSASILVPLPGLAIICTGGIFLFPPAVAILAGAAEAIGELAAYGLGYSGRGAVEKHRLYPVGRRWMQRRGGLVLLIASSVPNPAFDVLGIIAGGLHYPVRRFLLAVWIGKTIKSFGIVYACYFGFADLANRIPNWLANY